MVCSTVHHTQPPHLAQSTLSGTTGATEDCEDEQQEDDMQEWSHEVIDKLVDTLDIAWTLYLYAPMLYDSSHYHNTLYTWFEWK